MWAHICRYGVWVYKMGCEPGIVIGVMNDKGRYVSEKGWVMDEYGGKWAETELRLACDCIDGLPNVL